MDFDTKKYCVSTVKSETGTKLLLADEPIASGGITSDITLTCITINEWGKVTKNWENKSWTHMKGTYGNIIAGFYPENFFYAWEVVTTDSYTMYFYKYIVTDTGLSGALEHTITLSRQYTYAIPLIYFKELNAIYVSGAGSTDAYRWVSLLDINSWTFICDNNDTTNSMLYVLSPERYMFGGVVTVLPQSKKVFIAQNNPSAIPLIDFNTGTASYLSLTFPTSAET